MGTGIANARSVQWGQMTPAQQVLAQFVNGTSRRAPTRKRRSTKKKAASAGRKRRKTAKRGGKARLVKGSAAAKRYMAKIRRMRKKKRA